MTTTITTEPGAGPALTEDAIRPERTRAARAAALAEDVARLLRRRAEFRTAACPACAGAASRLCFEKHGLAWTRCDACGTAFMNPRPTAAIMADYYAHSALYALWAAEVFPAVAAARRASIHAPRLDYLRATRDRLAAGRGLLLEVGAGDGGFSRLVAEERAYDAVVALEPTVARPEGLDPRIAWRGERIEELPDDALPPVDAVVSYETIEHLLEPRAFVAGCARRLRPGGLLVLTCPGGSGFEVETLGAAAPAVQPEHLNLFTPAALAELLAACGLEVVEVTTPGRLDVELVRTALREGRAELGPGEAFLRRVLLEEPERLAAPFQQFLAANGLSSHLRAAARRPA